MSRTSKALKRLGVAGVVVATIGAGVPAFFATSASAAGPTDRLVISGPSSASAGDCAIFSVVPQDSAGATPTDTQGQEILLTATPTGTNQVSFCQPTPAFPNTGAGFTTGTATTRSASGTATPDADPNADGSQTFGVRSDSPGGYNIRAFVDTTGVSVNNNNTFDAGEPTGTKTVTATAGGSNTNDTTSGGNGAQDAVSTITEAPQPTTAGPVAAGQGNQFVTAQLKNGAGDVVSGVTVNAFFGAGSANGAQPASGTTAAQPAQTITCTGGSTKDNGSGTIVLGAPTNSTTDTGSQNVAAVSNNSGFITCYYAAARAGSDTITLFVNQTDGTSTGFDSSAEPSLTVTRSTGAAPNTNTNQARYVDLTPEGPITTVSGTDRVFTATVTDAAARPVQGVQLDFTLTGTAGTFANGTAATSNVLTNAQGQATVTVKSVSGQTGQATVTVTIEDTSFGSGAANGDTQCDAAAGAGGTPATSTSTAGNCQDAEVTNFVASSPSPSPSSSPSGSASPGTARPVLSTSTPDIQPNIQGIYTATGASPNSVLELRCYTRPSTTYFTARSTTVNATGGPVEFRILPGANTRCYARPAGNDSLSSNSVVINVHTTLSLSTVRTGVRTYIFQGRNLPRRAGQLITLYRVNAAGQEIRTSNLTTDASGIYRVTRTFSGTGTFRFKVRTSQTLNNAAGVSNTITVTVH